MTTAALAWGSAFVAFGPFASLLFGIAWHKAQLIIVVTTSAFAYLLAAFLSSLIYLMLNAIGIGNSVVSILLPGVVFSFISKCYFVKLYHKVEKVISVSIARHEERQGRFENPTTGSKDLLVQGFRSMIVAKRVYLWWSEKGYSPREGKL